MTPPLSHNQGKVFNLPMQKDTLRPTVHTHLITPPSTIYSPPLGSFSLLYEKTLGILAEAAAIHLTRSGRTSVVHLNLPEHGMRGGYPETQGALTTLFLSQISPEKWHVLESLLVTRCPEDHDRSYVGVGDGRYEQEGGGTFPRGCNLKPRELNIL